MLWLFVALHVSAAQRREVTLELVLLAYEHLFHLQLQTMTQKALLLQDPI